MKRVLCYSAVLIVVAPTLAQSPGPAKPAPAKVKDAPKPARLSTYMRDAGLEYIQAVEDAMEPAADRAGLTGRLLEAANKLGDHIQVHAETQADKDFYIFGLAALWDAASAIHVFRAGASPSADIGQLEEVYVGCRHELRSALKAGEYAGYEALHEACTLKPKPPPEPKQ